MHLFKRITVAALLLAAAGCTKPDKGKAPASGQATFIIDKAGGGASRGKVSNGAPWKVPSSIYAGFNVCVSDRSSNQPVRNQDFTVLVPGTTTRYNVTTTTQGCFHWNEDIPFNYFAGQSAWVRIQRVIVGRGVNSGERTVEFAINPWATGDGARDGGRSVYFMRDGDNGELPENIAEASSANAYLAGDDKSQGQAQLIIQDVRVKALPEKEGAGFVTLTYVVEMEPRIRTRKANGEYSYDKVADGDFNVWLQILSANAGPQMDQKVLLLGGDPFSVAKVVDGKLTAEVKIRQEKRVNQGNLELAMKVQPRSLGTMATIRAFHGLYRLGSDTSIGNGGGTVASVCLEEGSKACDFSTIVASAKNAADLEKAGYLRPNQRYVFSNLRLRFLMVMPGETATQRTVAYTASTCITDIQTGKDLANTPMNIRYQKDTPHAKVEADVITKSTDESGCLNWDGKVFHKYYQPEEYFERNITIEKASGFSEKFTFYVNPWDTNINFGFDRREFTESTIQEILNGRAKVRSRFFLGGYQYHTVRFLYNIDPYMDLEVKKTVLMELQPEVLRYSGIKDARKMTENLRDGIYMLKVGIQKSYLDPRDNSQLLISNKNYQAEASGIIPGRQLAIKEFVTTNMSLVRVVSGLIIVPMELTMRDLRLMRVRSNFMIQLETVDERLIQAYHVFKKHAVNAQDLENKLKDFREKLKEGQSLTDVQGQEPLAPPLKDVVEERQKLSAASSLEKAQADLESRVKKTQELVGASLLYLKQRLENGGALGTYLNSAGKTTEVPVEIQRDSNIIDNFKLNEDILNDLRTALKINDFSEVGLPAKGEVEDLNIFIEPDSGLQKRSFVGPVIFLSNAYSDSARATDNLDEAGCTDPSKRADALKQSQDELFANMREKQIQMYGHKDPTQPPSQFPGVWLPEAEQNGKRQNNAYQFSKFYGALTHLCYKHVDDLIQEEKRLNGFRQEQAFAMSLKSNFIDFAGKIGLNLEYVSLTNEPLVRLKEDCQGPTVACLEATRENTVSKEKITELVNADLKHNTAVANTAAPSFLQSVTFSGPRSRVYEWKEGELSDLFFRQTFESHIGLCNLLANKIAGEIRDLPDFRKVTIQSYDNLRHMIIEECAAADGLIHDLKYHVGKTGNYAFLGGLNLNINVGESFSTSWSKSWSGGFEVADVIGAAGKYAGGFAGVILKPASLKVSSSMSESSGTNISESTYLVSQIAGFQLDLLAYEKCAVVALSPAALRNLRWRWGDNFAVRGINKVVGMAGGGDISNTAYNDERVVRAVRRGYMVCEGDTRQINKPISVKESYFYFTQHFTEGDMLDQADLYNHPWLIGMRGMRDFVTFVHRVRAQEVVGLGEYLRGLTGITPQKKTAWALNQMTWVYENVLPSFPGFYTVLEQGEDITFLLEQSRFTKVDNDPLGEVTRRQKIVNPELKNQGINQAQ